MGKGRWILGMTVAALLCCPVGARADITSVGLVVTPSTTAAGAHPDLTVTESFSYSSGTDSVRNTTLHFPPGLLGNPQATAKCAAASFEVDACPANTQVGSTSVVANVLGTPLPVTSPGKIYNLVPDASHPAVLGVVVTPAVGNKIFLKSPVSLRTSGDFGIDSPVNDTPNTQNGLSIQITSVSLTLFGKPPGSSAPFMSNPTSCKPATTKLDAVSWDAPSNTATGSSTFTPTACDKLPFAPKLSASMGAPRATAKGTRPPFEATITQAVGESPQLSALVTLPASLGIALNSVSTLCTQSQLAAAACPAEARVGTATIASPLLPTAVQGTVFLVASNGLPGVGVEFGGTLPFVLSGSAGISGGRLQNSFSGLPDVPLSSFKLAIDGGPHGLLTPSRDLCTGPVPTVDGAFTGQNGASTSLSVPVTVVGCGPSAIRPRATASARGLAGRHPLLQVTVRKGANVLRSVTVTLPKGIRVISRRRGVSAKGASFKLSRKSIRLSRKGKLTLKLPSTGASRITAKLTGRAIRASKALKAKLKRHKKVTLRLTVRTLDAANHHATLRLKLTGRR